MIAILIIIKFFPVFPFQVMRSVLPKDQEEVLCEARAQEASRGGNKRPGGGFTTLQPNEDKEWKSFTTSPPAAKRPRLKPSTSRLKPSTSRLPLTTPADPIVVEDSDVGEEEEEEENKK